MIFQIPFFEDIGKTPIPKEIDIINNYAAQLANNPTLVIALIIVILASISIFVALSTGWKQWTGQ